MDIYILKSAACLSIFFAFYKLVLENTSLHTSKRIYLLGALVVSFIIPFLTFTTYVEMPPMVTEAFTSTPTNTTVSTEVFVEKTNYTPYILWSIYGLGVLFFGYKFSRNLIHILLKIKNNPSVTRKPFYDVLIKENTAPHTFFNRLFFNKKSYQAQEFPQEVFWHEEAHARQKHSADLLLIELMQVVFWFNPLCYLFKGAIKLNHEFLADREVLHKTQDTAQYQNILLSFSTPQYLKEQGLISFANSINYSSIKKRFTIMKTHTSKKAALLKGLLVLPLLALVIYGFSEIKEEFISTEKNTETITVTVDKEKTIWINSVPTNIDNIKSTLKSIDINPEEKNYIAEIIGDKSLNMGFMSDVKNELFSYGLNQVKIPESVITEPAKEKTKTRINGQEILQLTLSDNKITYHKKNLNLADFKIKLNPANYSKANITLSDPITEIFVRDVLSFLNDVDLLNKASVCQNTKDEISSINSGNIMSNIFKEQREQTKNSQQDYTKAYLDGAKRNNKKVFVLLIENNIILFNGKSILLNQFAKAVDRYTKDWEETDYTESLPSIIIKNSSKEFLDKVDAAFRKTRYSKANGGMNIIPPPPPSPPKVKKGEASNIPPPPPPTSRIVKKGEVSNIPPPPPVASTNPLDHIINMAKENAAFLYNGKRITSDKAIVLVKENANLNISTEHFNNSNPIVKITDAPIQLKE